MKIKPLFVTVATLAVVAFAVPVRPVVVLGPSMSPTLRSGSLLLASKTVGPISRGDVVVFIHDGETLIKRVAYLEGDHIAQFKWIDEWMIPTNDLMVAKLRQMRVPEREYVVPSEQVYVLGDNPSASRDSRVFGAIPMSSITGKVLTPNQPQDWESVALVEGNRFSMLASRY